MTRHHVACCLIKCTVISCRVLANHVKEGNFFVLSSVYLTILHAQLNNIVPLFDISFYSPDNVRMCIELENNISMRKRLSHDR